MSLPPDWATAPAGRRLLAAIAALGPGRRLIGLAGPPGSGKSTLAAALVDRLPGAALVPMDGFHLDNTLLDARGLRARKGAPETFDAAGFAAALTRLRAGAEVILPTFDRSRDLAIAGALRVGPEHRLLVIEGNYLLLDAPIWRDLRALFDLTVMLAVPEAELTARLTARWQGLDKPPAAVAAHLANDLANARQVARAALPADLTI